MADILQSIQSLIDQNTTDAMGMVVGFVSPQFDSPQFLFGGQNSMQNSEGNPMPLSQMTLFEIGSITKTFTSSMFMVNSPDHDAFTGYFGDYVCNLPLPPEISSLPAQSLANYSSGFAPDNGGAWMGTEAMADLQDMCDWLNGPKFPNKYHPLKPPGTVYSYSNTAWSLLALAAVGCDGVDDQVREKYDVRLSAMLQQLSLEMPSTQLYQAWMTPFLPLGYWQLVPNGPVVPMQPTDSYDPVYPCELMFGSGSIISNGQDMMQWLQFNMGQGTAGAAWYPMLAWQQGVRWNLPNFWGNDPNYKPYTVSYGWFWGQTPTLSAPYLWKNGEVGGFTSWMGFKEWSGSSNPVPSDTGLFVLCTGLGADQVGPAALAILLGESTTVRKRAIDEDRPGKIPHG
jgi:beta-lactamase class C